MVDFYGLRKLLSQEKLWTTEKDHSILINTIQKASSNNLPKNLLNEVFPYGSKSYDLNFKKALLCDKIQKNNLFPALQEKSLQEFSEQEMRAYIEELSTVLQNQFDECIESLYGINRNAGDFARIKEIFTIKFLRLIKIESAITFSIIPLCILIIIGLFVFNFITFFKIFVVSFAIIFVVLIFCGLSMPKYFRIDKDKYPRL